MEILFEIFVKDILSFIPPSYKYLSFLNKIRKWGCVVEMINADGEMDHAAILINPSSLVVCISKHHLEYFIHYILLWKNVVHRLSYIVKVYRGII